MLPTTESPLTFKTTYLSAKCLHSYVSDKKVLFMFVNYAQPVSCISPVNQVL